MSEFRTLEPSAAEEAKWAARTKLSPFIDVAGEQYALTLTAKRDLVSQMSPDGIVLFPWGGSYSTDVFELTVPEARDLVA